MVHRIEVTTKYPEFPDGEGDAILTSIKELGIFSISKVRFVKVYKLEGIDNKSLLLRISKNLLSEGLWQEYGLDTHVIKPTKDVSIVEVALRPGVMNTEIDSVMKSVSDMDIDLLSMAGSGRRYYFYGNPTNYEINAIIKKLLVNHTVEQVLVKPEDTLVLGGSTKKTEVIPIRTATDNELRELSKDKLWLTLPEMKTISRYFTKEEKDATDAELETIAQTWSEHCYHKTFKSDIRINGKNKKPFIKRIKEATEKIKSPYTVSVFVDNAGVIKFNKTHAISGKVETHNSPSAIEPYGGAATGSGGVFRDIVATGQGAKVLISTDMFCFAPPDLPETNVPRGCLDPKRLLKGVVRGVKDYGNRMGIPTNNGSLYFDEDFRAKPTVIVGAYGIMPLQYAKIGIPKVDDLILVVGGKTGRDGIHGATFSSGEMTDRTEVVSSTAVQIGNPIEQKRMFDALLEARDKGYIRQIQDCGGGGFSSAVGEIAKDLGCRVYLERAPLKYTGLAPWEIWISESQEREIVVIDKKYKGKIRNIFKKYNVPFAILGEFTGSKRLVVRYKENTVIDLDMDFLHNGIPKEVLEGIYPKPLEKEPVINKEEDLNMVLKQILSSWNVCSKEPIVRLYDHEVQGTSVIKPFTGVYNDGPSDASVIEPILDEGRGMAVSHGMHPTYNKIDSYSGTASAIDEAVRNLISVGVNPKRIALIDNFIFPKPQKEEIGQLDKAVDAIYDVSTSWKMPFVSGKDSLSSTYKGGNGKIIKIPPVVCISAFAPFDEVTLAVTSDFKTSGNSVYIIGMTKNELGGSEYYRLKNKLGANVPVVNIKKAYEIFTAVYKAINRKYIASCHDCSDGGLAVSLSEMCFGGNLGGDFNLNNVPATQKLTDQALLFSESNSRFVVEVPKKFEKQFVRLTKKVPVGRIGTVSAFPCLRITNNTRELIGENINVLKNLWKKPLQKIFS